jgi:hypothetical protein
MSTQGVFYYRIFLIRSRAGDQRSRALVQAINAVHPGVDAVNCIVFSNGMRHTGA